MSPYEYPALLAAYYYSGSDGPWCGTHPPSVRPPPPLELVSPQPIPPRDPSPVPWFDRFFGNVFYAGLAGLVLITAVTYKEQALSLPYGPLILMPAYRIAAGLYSNNVRPRDATKVKK